MSCPNASRRPFAGFLFAGVTTLLAVSSAGLLAVSMAGCTGSSGGGRGEGGAGDGGRKFVTLGTAPVGGAFAPVGNAIASVLNEHKGEHAWRVQAKGTKGSQQNIRMLDKGEIQLGMSNAAISYYACRGLGVWEKKYEIRSVVTLAPNIGLFITKKDSGINSIADLKGKRVAVGPSGAGFEMFLGPILTEHGVNYNSDGTADFSPINETYSAAVSLLGDGNADAAFMGGAVPTPAVTQACTSYDIHFIPYDPEVRNRLIEKYDFFQAATIPATNKDGKPTYKGMTEDFQALNVGSMQLITHADVDEELVYELTKTIWENRAEIVKQHRSASAINEQNAARYTGTEFHPGAIRYYREIGIWSAAGEPKGQPAAQEGDAKVGAAQDNGAKEDGAKEPGTNSEATKE